MVEAYFTEQHELIRKLAHDFAENKLKNFSLKENLKRPNLCFRVW